MSFLRRHINRVCCNDLSDLRDICQPFQTTPGENSVCANDQDLFHTLFHQHAAYLVDGSAGRDLVILDQRTFVAAHLIAHQSTYFYD